MIDPFYQADSTGILIYDPSGWMSVQIVAKIRPALKVPTSRPTRAVTAQDAQLKAAVFDTYYAYFGTWEFNEATSTVTHHINSSLISGETGISYSQKVTLEGGHLIFTARREVLGVVTVGKKVWQRIPVSNP